MATLLTSYDLNGKKDSFANWISNLSPTDTFFVSTTGKEQVKNTLFQWQTDRLAKADVANAHSESSVAVPTKPTATKLESNHTQILRKALEVSDTADALVNWGRGRELAYQMEKAGKEIKRDLEAILLQYTPDGAAGSAGDPGGQQIANVAAGTESTIATSAGDLRKTKPFGKLVAAKGTKDTDTDADVHQAAATSGTITEEDLFKITTNLYLAGSDADVIMFHPRHASFFSSLMEVANQRIKMIDNMDTTLNRFVGTIIDPLGQQYKLVPNRFMPNHVVYFFNPKDWTQMVLREPEKIKLAKKGSSERFMIEMEVGLRHRDPYASGILEIQAAPFA